MAKLFLTGGSGLLGQSVAQTFQTTGWHVDAPLHAELDLLDFQALDQALQASSPDLIIHCAAQRNPDLCEKCAPNVQKLNIDLPHHLAKKHIPLIHLSTDYVFNGANAPYEPDARRCPINAYGRQKAEVEARLETYDHVIILRVPILYGPTHDLRTSAVTVLADNLRTANGTPIPMDDLAIRYPTFTCDIAQQLLVLAPHVGKLHGIFHYSANEPMTKYQMALTMAPIIGCTPNHCQPFSRQPTVPRPYDCHLSTRRLQQLGLFVPPTPFREAIATVLTSI